MSTIATPKKSVLVHFFSHSEFVRAHTEFVESEDEEGLVDLEAEDFWLDESEGLSVDLDETFAGLAVGDGGRGLLLAELCGLLV